MVTRVRSVGSREVEALYRLRLRALAEDPDAFDQTVADAQAKGIEPLAELLAMAAQGQELVLFGEVDGVPSGVVFVSRSRRPRSGHRARLWGMWVAPEVRGRGVGRALVAEAVQWCREHGVEMVDLWVVTDHHRAIRMYERAGFRICGTARDGMRWQGVPQDEHQMTIHLPAPGRGLAAGGIGDASGSRAVVRP
jgi:GNAT superfamily N-acetyltransferase